MGETLFLSENLARNTARRNDCDTAALFQKTFFEEIMALTGFIHVVFIVVLQEHRLVCVLVRGTNQHTGHTGTVQIQYVVSTEKERQCLLVVPHNLPSGLQGTVR